MLRAIFLWAAKLLVAAVGILWVGLAAISLRTRGMRYRLQHNWRYSARSGERFLVGVGAKIASQTLRLLKAILDSLEKASADVGEWILHHR